jgi:hypothetical protein
MTVHKLLERLGPNLSTLVESTPRDAEFGEAIYLGDLRGRYVLLVLDKEGTGAVLCAERGGAARTWDIPNALSADIKAHADCIALWLHGTSGERGVRHILRARMAELLKLERGWLDGSGEPVPPEVAAWAERWLSEESDEDLVGLLVHPLEEGGIAIERRRFVDRFDVFDSVRVTKEICWLRCVGDRWFRVTVARAPPHELLELSAGRLGAVPVAVVNESNRKADQR